MQKTIYLDYNATTPIDPEVAEAMLPYLYGRFGNPSSNHPYGLEGKRAVDRARAQVARLLGCQTSEVVFTSLVGIVFLKDPATWRFWAGSLLIVASVLVLNIQGARRGPVRPKP